MTAVTQGLERIPDALGYLVLNEDGAVISSGGDLENDERLADELMSLIHTATRVPTAGDRLGHFKRISVVWDNFMYIITISNRRVYVSKRKHIPQEPAIA